MTAYEYAKKTGIAHALMDVCHASPDKTEEGLYGAMVDAVMIWVEQEGIEVEEFDGDDTTSGLQEFAIEVVGYVNIDTREFQNNKSATSAIEPAPVKYDIVSDFVGGKSATLSEIEQLISEIEIDGWNLTTGSNHDNEIRVYAEQNDDYDDDAHGRTPTRYDNWVKITSGEYYLVVAKK